MLIEEHRFFVVFTLRRYAIYEQFFEPGAALAGSTARCASERKCTGYPSTCVTERLSSLCARANSPFYRDLYQHLPEEINDLSLLPLVTKPELMARFNDWVTDPRVNLAGIKTFLAEKKNIGQPYLGQYLL